MTTCTDCPATFFYVPARQYPNLCLDHAAEVSRDDGWTPENSVD